MISPKLGSLILPNRFDAARCNLILQAFPQTFFVERSAFRGFPHTIQVLIWINLAVLSNLSISTWKGLIEWWKSGPRRCAPKENIAGKAHRPAYRN